MSDADDGHYLDGYLAAILPELGLDFDTYAPYVTGYAEDNEEEDDDDALDELIALLRASSETRGEDDAAWEELKAEIARRRREHAAGESARREMQALEIQATTATNLQKEIALAQRNAVEMEARKQKELADGRPENMSAEKRAMLDQFGYEDDGEPEPGQGVGDSGKLTTNRDHAAAQVRQETEKKKTAGTQSKAEERKKTKQAKLDKLAKKEERRKKTAKKERQRM